VGVYSKRFFCSDKKAWERKQSQDTWRRKCFVKAKIIHHVVNVKAAE